MRAAQRPDHANNPSVMLATVPSVVHDILSMSNRIHNLMAFGQACKRLEEAVPGSLRLVPQAEPGSGRAGLRRHEGHDPRRSALFRMDRGPAPTRRNDGKSVVNDDQHKFASARSRVSFAANALTSRSDTLLNMSRCAATR